MKDYGKMVYIAINRKQYGDLFVFLPLNRRGVKIDMMEGKIIERGIVF